MASKLRRLLYDEQNRVCHYCSVLMVWAPAFHPDAVTVDHIVPKCEFGTRRRDNVVGACLTCNGARGNQPYTEFKARVQVLGRPGTSKRMLRKMQRIDAKREKAGKLPLFGKWSAHKLLASRPYLADVARFPTMAEALSEAGAIPDDLNENLREVRERWGA